MKLSHPCRLIAIAFAIASSGCDQKPDAKTEPQSDYPSSIQQSYETLRESKIPELVIENQPFSVGLEIIRDEWEKQHSNLSFPVAITEFGPSDEQPHSISRVTLKLKNVPFLEAILYLSESAR
ncbi:MAG: hypothetical protein ACQKBU_08925, partial [Verrucomicrobiales bacterium]